MATPYMLTCAARTGSTMLNTCIQRHPDVCAHGEVFGMSGPLSFYGVHYQLDPPLEQILVRLRNERPVWFLEEVVLQAGAKRAVGMKLKYEELLRPEWDAVRDRLRERTDVRIVHLTRDNLLERYLSQHIAVNVTKVYNVQQGDVPAAVRVRLEPDDCRADFDRTRVREQRIRTMFAGHEILEITYEQLVGDRAATLERLQAFLGIEPMDLVPATKKLRHRSVVESLENFDELATVFQGTPYARFFDVAA